MYHNITSPEPLCTVRSVKCHWMKMIKYLDFKFLMWAENQTFDLLKFWGSISFFWCWSIQFSDVGQELSARFSNAGQEPIVQFSDAGQESRVSFSNAGQEPSFQFFGCRWLPTRDQLLRSIKDHPWLNFFNSLANHTRPGAQGALTWIVSPDTHVHRWGCPPEHAVIIIIDMASYVCLRSTDFKYDNSSALQKLREE